MPKEKVKPRNLTKNDIYRRIDFILQEAKHRSPRDQTITYAMRVISNYCAIGKDASSKEVKLKCKRISSKALDLKKCLKEKKWLKHTINEHQEPLAQIWRWIRKNAQKKEKVLERFNKYPMVTITREENAKLKKNKNPLERYREIEVLRKKGLEWIAEKKKKSKR